MIFRGIIYLTGAGDIQKSLLPTFFFEEPVNFGRGSDVLNFDSQILTQPQITAPISSLGLKVSIFRVFRSSWEISHQI